jgi:hypothetical protein
MDAPGWYRLTGQLRQNIWAQRAEATGYPGGFLCNKFCQQLLLKKTGM